MALGQGQGGGLMGPPDDASLGPATWAELSGMHPANPLVGGSGNQTADGFPRIATMKAAASSAPLPGAEKLQGHPLELLNLSHNPIGWVLLAAIAYLGLVHLHVSGAVSAKAGR